MKDVLPFRKEETDCRGDFFVRDFDTLDSSIE